MFFDTDVLLRRGAVAKVVRTGYAGQVPCRVIRGWRGLAIDQCLDLCSRIEGHLIDQEWTPGRRRNEAGQAIYKRPAQYKRAWARRNVSAARENSKAQWVKSEATMRTEYAECGSLYRSIYAGVGVPGFDTWRRQFRKLWRQDRPVCLAAMHRWKTSTRSFETTENGVSGS